MTHLLRTTIIALIAIFWLPLPGLAVTDTLYEAAAATGKFAKDMGKKAGIGMDAAQIDREVSTALNTLLKTSPAAAKLAKKARAILVFPRIVKAGLAVGGQYGEGALRKNGKTVAYYSTAAGSYGLQIGGQVFGFAMFFMDDKGLDYLTKNNDGWEVGVGPSVVFVDEGMAKTINNTTLSESVYVFTFNQHGLMAGAGIQGSKITRIKP